jgi:hypothetical protein
MPDSVPRGFSIFLSDDIGTAGLFFSPDRAELALGVKNVGLRDNGIPAAAFDTTDAFHAYQLVRRSGRLYWHLYVDDDPVPRIADQHVDGSASVPPRRRPPRTSASGISSIRWARTLMCRSTTCAGRRASGRPRCADRR